MVSTQSQPRVFASFSLVYGTLHVIGFQRMELGTSVRLEEYIRHDDGKLFLESSHCAGEQDLSPPHDRARVYDSACSCCFLNIPHTKALHAYNLTR